MNMRDIIYVPSLRNVWIFCAMQIIFLYGNSYSAPAGVKESTEIKNGYNSFIEPTPVYARKTTQTSSYSKEKLDQDYWVEGSGRGRRPYNLEDFLVWLPSGDGPTEKWNYYSSDYDWRRHETVTVYVTSTKYETVVMPPYIVAAPTDRRLAYTTTMAQLGKDISSSLNGQVIHECRVYHVLKQRPSSKDYPSRGINKYDLDDYDVPRDIKIVGNNHEIHKGDQLPKIDNVDLSPSLPPTKSVPVTLEPSLVSYDPSDFVHSSIDSLEPSSATPTPYTDLVSPTLQTKASIPTDAGVTIFISSYYDMRSFDIDSTNIEYSSPTLIPPLLKIVPSEMFSFPTASTTPEFLMLPKDDKFLPSHERPLNTTHKIGISLVSSENMSTEYSIGKVDTTPFTFTYRNESMNPNFKPTVLPLNITDVPEIKADMPDSTITETIETMPKTPVQSTSTVSLPISDETQPTEKEFHDISTSPAVSSTESSDINGIQSSNEDVVTSSPYSTSTLLPKSSTIFILPTSSHVNFSTNQFSVTTDTDLSHTTDDEATPESEQNKTVRSFNDTLDFYLNDSETVLPTSFTVTLPISKDPPEVSSESASPVSLTEDTLSVALSPTATQDTVVTVAPFSPDFTEGSQAIDTTSLPRNMTDTTTREYDSTTSEIHLKDIITEKQIFTPTRDSSVIDATVSTTPILSTSDTQDGVSSTLSTSFYDSYNESSFTDTHGKELIGRTTYVTSSPVDGEYINKTIGIDDLTPPTTTSTIENITQENGLKSNESLSTLDFILLPETTKNTTTFLPSSTTSSDTMVKIFPERSTDAFLIPESTTEKEEVSTNKYTIPTTSSTERPQEEDREEKKVEPESPTPSSITSETKESTPCPNVTTQTTEKTTPITSGSTPSEMNKTKTTLEPSTVFSYDGSTSSLPKLPPQISPSPSNNLTVPLHRKFWIRSLLFGLPESKNSTIIVNEMEYKLEMAYKLAFERSNSSGFVNVTVKESLKIPKMQSTGEDKGKMPLKLEKIKRNENLSQKKEKSAPNRTRRQSAANIDVRMQNISYNIPYNMTELIYSVFEDDAPILASRAVAMMDALNDSEMEELMGYPLALKAKEYLEPVELQESQINYLLYQIFALVIGVSGICFLTIFGVFFMYKRFKKRQTIDSSRHIQEGSEISSPRSLVPGDVATSGTDNIGYIDSHDEESTPEGGMSRQLTPEATMDPAIIRPQPAPSGRSSASSRGRDEEGGTEYPHRGGDNSVVIENEKKDSDSGLEPLYSTPKPFSQRQANIHTGLQYGRFPLPQNLQEGGNILHPSEFIPGTSLPKFLPPPRPQFPLAPSPLINPERKPPRSRSLDESQWLQEGEDEPDVLPSQVQDLPSGGIKAPTATMSKASSELDLSSESGKNGGVLGIGRLRTRFHELLDDAFGLMHGQKPSDKVTHFSKPYHHVRRFHSAMPATRSTPLETLEDKYKVIGGPRRLSRATRRPWSAAPAFHSTSESTSQPTTDSIDISPRAAWDDQGRGSITPVNYPILHLESRPGSATVRRGSSKSRGRSSPVPTDPETGLKLNDPAVPLIKAIKEELQRFRSSVLTDTTDA